MYASKLLISTAAAIAVVGTIGIAYAQSTDANATAPITPGQAQVDSAAPSASMPVPPSLQNRPAATGTGQSGTVNDLPATSTTPSTNPTTTPAPADATVNQQPMSTDATPTERAPQADRN